MQVLGIESMRQSLLHHGVRDPLSFVKISKAGSTHWNLEIILDKLASSNKRVMGPHTQHLLGCQITDDIRISQLSIIPRLPDIRTGFEEDFETISPISSKHIIDWADLGAYLQGYIFQLCQGWIINYCIQNTVPQLNDLFDLVRIQLDPLTLHSGIELLHI